MIYIRTYIIKRLLGLIPLIFGITFLVFIAINFIPGDPARIMLGVEGTEAMAEQVRQEMGLDQPLMIRYFNWLSQSVRGDLGYSLLTRRSVSFELSRRFPVTFQLTLLGVIFSVALALPLGIISAINRDNIVDFFIRVFSLIGISLPNFAIGILLILFVSKTFNWTPPVGFVNIWVQPGRALSILLLPVLALGASLAASVSRMTRSSMLEVLKKDFIRTARSKGLKERVVLYNHALKNALIPVLTLIGLQIGYLLGGTVIIEEVFSLPGLGRLLLTGIHNRDYPVVMGCILVIAISFAIINAIVDITYSFIDPRIKYD